MRPPGHFFIWHPALSTCPCIPVWWITTQRPQFCSALEKSLGEPVRKWIRSRALAAPCALLGGSEDTRRRSENQILFVAGSPRHEPSGGDSVPCIPMHPPFAEPSKEPKSVIEASTNHAAYAIFTMHHEIALSNFRKDFFSIFPDFPPREAAREPMRTPLPFRNPAPRVHAYANKTSSIVYIPGTLPTSHFAARSAPAANTSRVCALCVNSTRSNKLPYCTV